MPRYAILAGVALAALAIGSGLAASRSAGGRRAGTSPAPRPPEMPAAPLPPAPPLNASPTTASAAASGELSGAPGGEASTTAAAVLDVRGSGQSPPRAASQANPSGQSGAASAEAARIAPARGDAPSAPEIPTSGFGTRARAPASDGDGGSPSAPSRTWHLPPEAFKVAIGEGTVDIVSEEPLHAGAQLPVLFVAGRPYASSSYRGPNTLRFTEVGPVSPADEIAIAYGVGRRIVVRRGGSR